MIYSKYSQINYLAGLGFNCNIKKYSLIFLIAIFYSCENEYNIESIVKSHTKFHDGNIRVIIIPTCSSCYKDIIRLILEHENNTSKELFLMIGNQAAINKIKIEYPTHLSKTILYKKSIVDVSGYAYNKTYLFSTSGELLHSDYLTDYLNTIMHNE